MKIIRNNEAMSKINRTDSLGTMTLTMKNAFDDHDDVEKILDKEFTPKEKFENDFVKDFEKRAKKAERESVKFELNESLFD